MEMQIYYLCICYIMELFFSSFIYLSTHSIIGMSGAKEGLVSLLLYMTYVLVLYVRGVYSGQ